MPYWDVYIYIYIGVAFDLIIWLCCHHFQRGEVHFGLLGFSALQMPAASQETSQILSLSLSMYVYIYILHIYICICIHMYTCVLAHVLRWGAPLSINGPCTPTQAAAVALITTGLRVVRSSPTTKEEQVKTSL